LPEYVRAEQGGLAGETRWQPVAAHLAGCPHCAEARAELSDLVQAALAASAPPPDRAPAPDLGFLEPARAQPSTAHWRLDELGRLVVELTDQLLGTLLPPARQPAVALAGLKSAAPGTLFELPIDALDAGLHVTLQAVAERPPPSHDAAVPRGAAERGVDQCTLAVQVEIPDRGGWPNLGGTEVTLKQGACAPRQEWTDAYGEAVFERVAVENLAGLVIEVLPDG
jgi:hypothetical protein